MFLHSVDAYMYMLGSNCSLAGDFSEKSR